VGRWSGRGSGSWAAAIGLRGHWAPTILETKILWWLLLLLLLLLLGWLDSKGIGTGRLAKIRKKRDREERKKGSVGVVDYFFFFFF